LSKYSSRSLEELLASTLTSEPGCYSIAVKDLSSGRRLALNPDPLRSASLIKIFIMIEAFRQVDKKLFELDEQQPITAIDRVDGGPLENAPEGTRKTWRELIELMIIESDNTATNMLIDHLTMEKINALTTKLGCTDTILRRKMMDFAAAAEGRENITSVTDMTAALEMIYHHRCLDANRDEAMLDILKRQTDKCKIPVLLPPTVVVAHKTGELEGAEHDAGIVYGPRAHYIIAVMADSLPDAVRGQETIARLSRTVYDFLNTMD